MQRRHLLSLCSILAACATPVAQQPPPPQASVRTETSLLLSAVGTYVGPGHEYSRVRDAIVLHEHHGNWWLIADRYLLSVQVEPRGADFVLRLPQLAAPSEGEKQPAERLPREFVFHPGTPADPGWRYQAGDWTGKQFVDPVAARVVRRGETVTLRRLDYREPGAQIAFRQHVALLRHPTPERLRELDPDPEAVAAAGGPEGFAAQQLAAILSEVEPSVPGSERAWFARQRDLLTATRPALWPASEDARMLEIVTRPHRSRDTIEIADGWLGTVVNRDENRHRGCRAGVIFPEPSCNSAHDLHAAPAAERGRVSRLCYAFFQTSDDRLPYRGDSAPACELRPAPGQAHKRERGFPFYLLVDADSRIVGAQLVGYMTAELYLAPGVTHDLLRAMLDAHSEEVGRQAE